MSVLVEINHRVNPLTPTAYDRYVDLHREVAVPFFERGEWELLGAWKWSTGPMGRYTTLLRVGGPGDVTGATLASLTAQIQTDGGFALTETITVAEAVPYATDARLSKALEPLRPGEPRRQYMLARLALTPAGRPLAHELVAELADSFDERGRMRLVTGYQALVGSTCELTDLWVMDRLGDLGYRPSSPSELVDRLRTVAPDESIDYLNPLPHSPLQ